MEGQIAIMKKNVTKSIKILKATDKKVRKGR